MVRTFGRSGSEEWEWPCTLYEVVDGDTVRVVIDRGFSDRTIEPIRLSGIDTSEIHFITHGTREYEKGLAQMKFVSEWLDERDDSKWPYTLETYEQEGKFGRWIGDIKKGEESLVEAILEKWPETKR